nr:hypothetical protein Iba_chr05dCG0980 [Ipomoea batatas]GME10559.1 hypothetical protein Iba_scaffold10236CG0040 [Ipomoea batatas]GME16660.1 hypothetical protein Iba_scaffold17818CG0020 [Ipomoea batatas]
MDCGFAGEAGKMRGADSKPETEEKCGGQWQLDTPKPKRRVGSSVFERRADSRVMPELINLHPRHQEKKTRNTTQQMMSQRPKTPPPNIPSNTTIFKGDF